MSSAENVLNIKTGDNLVVFMYYHLHQKINLTWFRNYLGKHWPF